MSRFRSELALKVSFCTCGAYVIQVIAAEEITCNDYGYEAVRPLHFTLVDLESESCNKPLYREIMMPSAKGELHGDILNTFREIRRELDDETIQLVQEAVQTVLEAVERIHMEHMTSLN